jgi:Domain of unknown function (DUF4388)
MATPDKTTVSVSARLSKFIGAKATREKKLQAASMQAEFTLTDTLIMLCYLGRDADPEIAAQARTNLIPAVRKWHSRPDRPDLPDPIRQIVEKIVEKIGSGRTDPDANAETGVVHGNIGLLGLGEIIQAVDHNSRTVSITMEAGSESAVVYTENGKVVGAVAGNDDGMDAIHKAFGWADAPFRYVQSPPGDFENRIEVNTTRLVFDALEYIPDEDPFDRDVSDSWSVEGNLHTMNVFEISEIFEMNSKQCLCRLSRDDDEGVLYFNNGRIINADLRDMTGMDAACHLLAWPNARFVIVKGGKGVEEVIHVGMQNLIIEAMRLVDEGVTVSDEIASELALIDELFDGADVASLPLLEKVRIVFGEDESAREVLETDAHPLVRKALKVKISKTVHKYLNPATDHELRLRAARGLVPLSTTERLVLLSYLSHDEFPDIRDRAKETLALLDVPTYRKGFGADLHPAVMDFLVRETIKDESVLRVACSSASIQDDTALYILENHQTQELLETLAENTKLLERSSLVVAKLSELSADLPEVKKKIDIFETSLLEGAGDLKVEGPLHLVGLRGLLLAAGQGNRSGTIVLDGLEQSGRVYFSEGKMIGAVCGSLEGKPALEQLLKDPDQRFRYVLRTHFHSENVAPTAVADLINSVEAGPKPIEKSRSGVHFVSGNLQAMDVFDVLSALEGTPVPVRLSVICEEGTGEIYRDGARILHCHVDGKDNPVQAMGALLTWTGKRFVLSRASEDFKHTVDKTLGDFVTESLKDVADESQQLRRPGELPEWELSEEEYESLYFKILNMGVAEKIKLAMLGNKEARSILVRDAKKMVAVAVAKSPKITISEVEAISKSRQVCDDVLRQIAATKEFMRSYSVKVNLCNNSKTPVPIAMKLLPQLREHDLRKLAKSKNIPQAIATHARRLAEAKRPSR